MPREPLLQKAGLSCVLKEKQSTQCVAGKISGNLCRDFGLKIVGQVNNYGSAERPSLHFEKRPAHTILIYDNGIIAVCRKFTCDLFPVLLRCKSRAHHWKGT
jgi:hypothetical protein